MMGWVQFLRMDPWPCLVQLYIANNQYRQTDRQTQTKNSSKDNTFGTFPYIDLIVVAKLEAKAMSFSIDQSSGSTCLTYFKRVVKLSQENWNCIPFFTPKRRISFQVQF